MLKDQCEIVRLMKIKDVLRDKSFRLIACFYVFLGILIFHLEAYAQSAQSDYGLMTPRNDHWYSQPWIFAVLTAVLILLVAINGRIEKPSGVKSKIRQF
ncbi:hypothetical protein B0I27_10138 [Arcticibacter pallidicorallinus]|uniref:Uncharacterized protein n=2 Tax=Arcticibacter pallidicorallinus TaxID=1259464 RepID=A0A2T0UAX5_9SPHI|nr:hypothetical protein B0I27_10138 [Arcticibacter pallidicorallinus]